MGHAETVMLTKNNLFAALLRYLEEMHEAPDIAGTLAISVRGGGRVLEVPIRELYDAAVFVAGGGKVL